MREVALTIVSIFTTVLLQYSIVVLFQVKDGDGKIGELSVLWHGVHTTVQHSAATAVGWQLEQSFALFVSAHTGQAGSKD